MQFSPAWFDWEELQRLMSLFVASHVEVCFSGDAVCDALLGRQPEEVCILTSAGLDYVTTILVTSGIVAKVGQRQIAVDIHGRHFVIRSVADVARHESFVMRVKLYLEQSADVTLSALFLNPQGELYDFFGAVEDARSGRIVLLRPAQSLIAEDASFILRYVYLIAVYGGGEFDADIYEVCRKHSEALRTVEGQSRIVGIMSIAILPHGAKALRMMARDGILAEALGFSVSGVQSFEHLYAIEVMLKIKPDKETRLLLFAALASVSVAEALAVVAAPYGWSEAMLEYYGWIAEQMRLRVGIDPVWRDTMGDKGFRRLVLGAWAMDEEVVEDAADYHALWGVM